jgi:lipoyl-dependent peroxiredoxin
MPVVYTAIAISIGNGRDGHVETDDGRIGLDLATPKLMGGTGAGANPEQLVAMGYAACFCSTVHLAARRQRIDLFEVEITCKVALDMSDDGYSLSFDIAAHLANLASDQAEALVAEAHSVCPYSRAFSRGAPTRAYAVYAAPKH